MLNYRSCTEQDRRLWTELNRAFMAEEIQDTALWNNAGEAGVAAIYPAFSRPAY